MYDFVRYNWFRPGTFGWAVISKNTSLSLSSNYSTRYVYKKNSNNMYFVLNTNKYSTFGIASAPKGARAYYKIGNTIVNTGAKVGERKQVAVAFDKPGKYKIRAKDYYGKTKTITVNVKRR